MTVIDAIYTGSKFQPIGTVSLAENERVRLTIEPSPATLNTSEILQRIQSAKSIAEWVDATRLMSSEDGDYDIVERLRENRKLSGEIVPPKDHR